MTSMQPPVVKAQMLIRKPAADVFEAFLDPDVTTRFWFTHSSGRLEQGRTLTWTWAMYGVSTQVTVKAVEATRRILIAWDDPSTDVEWLFEARAADATLVTITQRGFHGSDTQIVAQAIDSMGGFSLVLAGLKALMEHGVELKLVGDHAPDAIVASGGIER
jgi:uncharacterized protein YndB with AHSA1/START domain